MFSLRFDLKFKISFKASKLMLKIILKAKHMCKASRRHKKMVAFVLFTLCLGSISIVAQNMPRTYVAYNTTETVTVDGKMTELAWQKAQWSQLFKDIEGEKAATHQTRVKMIWDEDNLYFFAQLNEPQVWATLKQKDTVIFYNNDFEIFIDPDGDTHDYYELEINALNTIWDLYLSKPYRNGSHVLTNWDVKGLQSAVQINGTLNDPKDIDEGWSIEIAIPWSFTKGPVGKTIVPKNEFWRLNFSRVNWDYELTDQRYSRKKDGNGNYLPEYNWVWSPQGVINMHEPEHWGYVYFSVEAVGADTIFEIPQDDHIKWYLYELYRDYRGEGSRKVTWSENESEFTTLPKLILGKSISPRLETNSFGFTIWTISPFTGDKLIIHHDGKFERIAKEA
ncbi:MAG: hypothetical protein ACI9SG_002103 [Maribacter sp.]